MAAIMLLSLMSVSLSATAGPAPGTATSSADLPYVEGKAILLPAPNTTGGAPLMQALSQRHSTRSFKPDALPLALLSDLLWAANGVNRADDGRRTAATAHNWQSLDVYVATPTGLFRHDAQTHALVPVQSGDHRAATGRQPFAADAPINLVYVSDRSKLAEVKSDDDKLLYDGVHSGIVSQNVYLYCASAGLATVVRASVEREALAKTMMLPATKRVLLAQSVGYPKP